MTPEGKVKAKVKSWLYKTFPSVFEFMPVSNGMGKHGIPDHVCCVPVTITDDMVGQTIGVFVGIEAKTSVGKLSKHQERRLEEITNAGGIVEVVYGTDEGFDRMVESLTGQLR